MFLEVCFLFFSCTGSFFQFCIKETEASPCALDMQPKEQYSETITDLEQLLSQLTFTDA